MPGSRRAVVTGATSGIGEAVVRRLAADGATVVMVGRSRARLDDASRRVLDAVPDADLVSERADLSSTGEVRELADRLAEQPPPDVVVSNAAVIADAADRTPEGLPRTLATNHLAPYLLLRSLAAALGARRSRFVVVGADPRVLRRLPVDLDDLTGTRGRSRLRRAFVAYSRTKNMNAMFGYALARRLDGTGITVNGAHPGFVGGTGIARDLDSAALRVAGRLGLDRLLAAPDAGADTPTWLATSPDVEGVTGAFFASRTRVATAPHTTDPARCDRLWEESARLVGLPP